MFCQNCGTKNNDVSIFCENCGAKLEKPVDAVVQQEQAAQEQPVQQEQAVQQEQPVQQEQFVQQPVQQTQPIQQPVKPKKPVPKLVIAVIAEAVVLVALVLVFFNVGKSVYGPEKVAEKFFVEVANQNFEEAYKVLDVEENDFINQKAFENARCNVELSKVTEYKIKDTRGEEDDEEREIEIAYKTKGSSSKRSYDISVNKQDSKNMLFFDKWEVSPDAMIVKDFYVAVPNGAEVTVDGVKLGGDYLKKSKSDEYQQYYVIPELFAGEHQIVVTKEGMAEVRKLVDTDWDYGYSLYSMQMDEELLKEAADTGVKNFEAIYKAAAEGKEFDAVANLFSNVEGRKDEGKDDYEDIVYDLTGSSYKTLNKISFSNVEATASEGYIDTDETCVTVYVEFDYNADYTEDWFGDITNETYDDNSYMYMDFVYEDGKWMLAEVGGGYIYY